MPSVMAIDVTTTFLNLFKWGFILCMINLTATVCFCCTAGIALAGQPAVAVIGGMALLGGLCVYALGMCAFDISVWILRYR